MTPQYSYTEAYSNPEFEYQAEELQKRLHFSLANFAQIRFKRSMQLRMSVLNDVE